MSKLKAILEKYDNQYSKFDQIKEKLSAKRDVCAFLLLEKIAPSEPGCKLITGKDDYSIFLGTDCALLAEKITDEDALTLVRCGVRFDEDADCLAMFL